MQLNAMQSITQSQRSDGALVSVVRILGWGGLEAQGRFVWLEESDFMSFFTLRVRVLMEQRDLELLRVFQSLLLVKMGQRLRSLKGYCWLGCEKCLTLMVEAKLGRRCPGQISFLAPTRLLPALLERMVSSLELDSFLQLILLSIQIQQATRQQSTPCHLPFGFIDRQYWLQFKQYQMSRITEQLLRKRSEHNECCLTTLEEISLHQQELLKIQNLDILCRHLKIVYLQNNIIEKMENLSKLKELQYLNLALNNITRIQNIQGCESLKKLDMTVNFVDVTDLYDSVQCLSRLPNLKELYMTGNPCEAWNGCKDYIIAHVHTLEAYNGELITPSQRIKAQQLLPALKASLYEAIEKRKLEIKKEEYDREERRKLEEHLSEEEKAKLKTPYTRESRREMYEKMANDKQKKEREKNPQKYKEEKPIKMYTNNGEIRQCNQGKFKFSLREFEDPDYSYFQIEVPKHLDTSELQVNINPKWVSVRIKKQLTQVKLGQEIIVHESKSARSAITGELLITMKKLHSQQFLRRTKEKQLKLKKQQQQSKKKKEKEQRQKRLRLCDEFEKKMQHQQDQIPDLE